MAIRPINEEAIFHVARQIDAAEVRTTYLNQVCGGDAGLRARIEALIAVHEEDRRYLASPAADLAATVTPPKQPGEQIGPYKLREQIGEGGMGVVYVAEQTEPVRRKVALKLIKPGLATNAVVARFDAERQALALMDHPNIARVFDAGATEVGQPYFVMELVQGPPINEYCDLQRATVRARLELFLKVCRAVHHAHQKGIIHRDLKPSNVLVPEIDGVAVPKVIDFGVAKAVDQKLTDQTVYTQFAQLVGTPLYMSPEQAGMGVVDIDTRSDVYSLGVLLYELLTGRTPFESERLKQAGYDEMRRIIREEPPRCPSAMVSTLQAADRSTVAECRDIDLRKLSNVLRGELDWLVMKALEKDRDRRYESASALAEDIERHLRNEPVIARPASSIYRIKKYAQRNRALVFGLMVVAMAMIAVSAVSVGFTIRSRRIQHETSRHLYASQMMQAVSAWEDRDYGTLETLLQTTTPRTSRSPDFRDWEWHFLNVQLQRPFATLPNQRVHGAAWHPQRNEIAVVVKKSESDSAIEIWKPGSRSPLRIVADLPGTVSDTILGFTWSANRNRIAFTTVQGRAVVLDADTGEILFDKQVHSGEGDVHRKRTTFAVSLSPTADIFATASAFGQIKIWDINTEKLVKLIFDPASQKNVRCVAFSPDGEHLAATLIRGLRSVWNLKTNARFDYVNVGDGSFGDLKWSADGKRFAATDNDKVAIYELGIAEPIVFFQCRTVRSVCWLDDNSIASCGFDQTIRVFDSQKGQLIRSLKVDRSPLWHVDVSQDGHFLASWGLAGLTVVELANEVGYDVLQPPEDHVGLESSVRSNRVRWSNDGHRIAVRLRRDQGPETLCIYDARTSRLEVTHDDIDPIQVMMCWSADDMSILEIDNRGRRFEYDANDLSLRTFNDDGQQFFDGFQSLALNPELGLLAIADDREVRICDPDYPQTADHLIPLPVPHWHTRLAWGPDNRSLLIVYVVHRKTRIQVYDLQRQQTVELPPIMACNEPVLAWDPTSTKVAIGGREAEIHILNLAAVEQRTTLVGHSAPIRELSWSPSGTRIASCAYDGTVRIWDAAHGDQLAVFHLPEDSMIVHSVQWSPDGQRLAAGGSKGEVYILNAGNFMPEASLIKHTVAEIDTKH